MNNDYQICTNCIMDTSDPTIKFDDKGVCHFCNNFTKNLAPNWFPNNIGIKKITPEIEKIKKEGKDKNYDCLIGISGGLDSSYVAYVAKNFFGLKPLLFHCDTGWNSDISTSNISKICEKLDLDLVTEVVNWDEMKDLQRAYFKSQVSFVDTPQDLALFSALYNFAAKNNFKYIITGGNNSTECVRECIDWSYFATDLSQVKDIHKQYGEVELKTFPMCDIIKYRIYYRWFKGIRVIKLLDYFPFKKEDAINELVEKFEWVPYPQKHFESRFTKFYESFWTIRKFNYDKRRAYFSSLILTNQMTRDEALELIKKPTLTEKEMQDDFSFVARKLGWTEEEFLEIFNAPNKNFRNYKNKYWFLKLCTKIYNFLGLDRRIFR